MRMYHSKTRFHYSLSGQNPQVAENELPRCLLFSIFTYESHVFNHLLYNSLIGLRPVSRLESLNRKAFQPF